MSSVNNNAVLFGDNNDDNNGWKSCLVPLFLILLQLWLPYLFSIIGDAFRRSTGAAAGARRGARAAERNAGLAPGAPGSTVAGAEAGALGAARDTALAPGAAGIDPAEGRYRRTRKLTEMSLVAFLSLTAGLFVAHMLLGGFPRSICIAAWSAWAFYTAAWLLTLLLGRFNLFRLILELGAAASFISIFALSFSRYNDSWAFSRGWRA